jgi:hypothetical protein
MTVLFHPEFPNDVRNFKEQYITIAANLGTRFQSEVDGAVEAVKLSPLAAGHLLGLQGEVASTIRRRNLRAFPFFILLCRNKGSGSHVLRSHPQQVGPAELVGAVQSMKCINFRIGRHEKHFEKRILKNSDAKSLTGITLSYAFFQSRNSRIHERFRLRQSVRRSVRQSL